MKFFKYLFIVILFGSCNKIEPSGFWLDYKNNLIISKHFDHGPYGGETKISWNDKERFRISEIIEYAENNGWNLIDSIQSNSETINRDDYSNEILSENVLSTLKEKNLSIYRFKTGWIAVKPGNKSDTEINGFVVLDSERTKLIVYQLWGE
ncbi:MAG: hypothetical protein V4670_10385 [Bacteroidota bacterium]